MLPQVTSHCRNPLAVNDAEVTANIDDEGAQAAPCRLAASAEQQVSISIRNSPIADVQQPYFDIDPTHVPRL